MSGEIRVDVLKEMDSQLLDKLMEEQTNMRAIQAQDDKNPKRTKIQKVPKIMQRDKDFEEYFKPTELSIGPLHAAKANLFKMELKVKLAAKFTAVNGYKPEIFLEEIRKNINDIKASFDDGVVTSYNNEHLSRLLFLDGCAILEFIQSYLDESLNQFGISNGQAALIKEDLFLLENQIPFQVLNLLIKLKDKLQSPTSSGEKVPGLGDGVLRFVLMNNIMAEEPDSEEHVSKLISDSNCAHFLDVLRFLLVLPDAHRKSTLPNCFSSLSSSVYSCFARCRSKIYILVGSCILLFCSVFRCKAFAHVKESVVLAVLRFALQPIFRLLSRWRKYQSFRNVQELKAAGIKLKASKSGRLKDISFQTRYFFWGHLKLPPLIVDNSTARKLLNLIACEMCLPDHQSNCAVTSYVHLLDLLIDSEEDVKDLRAADILRNRLSSDADVAKLFNNIGSNCLAPPSDTYLCIKNDIDKHCKRKSTIWIAQVYNTHFSSPWTILALLAAVTVLLLTAIQTWYTIHPKN